MGRYVSNNDIKARLVGKIRFTTSLSDENKMSENLLSDLIGQAESNVELDLSSRYAVPLQTVSGQKFAQLPANPTRLVLTLLIELQCIMLILEYGFGEASAMDGSKYYQNTEKRYAKLLSERFVKIKDDTYHTWQYPPLPGLQLAYQNAAADIGFLPPIEVTSSGHGDFAPKQINDPGEDFWFGNVEFDDEGNHGGEII